MSSLEKLQGTTSLSDLAILLGYKPKSLSYILYKIPNEKKYAEFEIPKKNGETRTINAPIIELKHLQRRLANLLNKCFEETCKKHNHKKSLSHGFRKNHSILTNALNHKRRRYVFNIDLKDFFPSINFGRVRGFFIKNNHFQLTPKIATIVAQIACHENELPQGSPCSPVISNLIGHLLDIRMVNLAKKTKCTYSRYADDLTFSTNQRQFPEKIAYVSKENEWVASKLLEKEIIKIGFSINKKKTSLQNKTSRQITTGLVVNKKVNIKKEYYKQARSMCHSLFNTGTFHILDPISSETKITQSINKLEGRLNFIYQIKKLHDDRKTKTKRHNPTAIAKLYREFLSYKHFHILNKPLIICEGKTDIIYLKCALKKLASDYSSLIAKENDEYKFKVSFLNISKNFKDIFSISGGTSGLAALMVIYKKYMRPFKLEGKQHPVIMLIDTDEGSEEIDKKIAKSRKTNHFSHYVENLYITHITSGDSEQEYTEIEDLFEQKVLETKVDGKTFNRKEKIDTKKEFGKIVFAEKVIKENQNTINFDGFKGIFNKLLEVKKDHSQQIAK